MSRKWVAKRKGFVGVLYLLKFNDETFIDWGFKRKKINSSLMKKEKIWGWMRRGEWYRELEREINGGVNGGE